MSDFSQEKENHRKALALVLRLEAANDGSQVAEDRLRLATSRLMDAEDDLTVNGLNPGDYE